MNLDARYNKNLDYGKYPNPVLHFFPTLAKQRTCYDKANVTVATIVLNSSNIIDIIFIIF